MGRRWGLAVVAVTALYNRQVWRAADGSVLKTITPLF